MEGGDGGRGGGNVVGGEVEVWREGRWECGLGEGRWQEGGGSGGGGSMYWRRIGVCGKLRWRRGVESTCMGERWEERKCLGV